MTTRVKRVLAGSILATMASSSYGAMWSGSTVTTPILFETRLEARVTGSGGAWSTTLDLTPANFSGSATTVGIDYRIEVIPLLHTALDANGNRLDYFNTNGASGIVALDPNQPTSLGGVNLGIVSTFQYDLKQDTTKTGVTMAVNAAGANLPTGSLTSGWQASGAGTPNGTRNADGSQLTGILPVRTTTAGGSFTDLVLYQGTATVNVTALNQNYTGAFNISETGGTFSLWFAGGKQGATASNQSVFNKTINPLDSVAPIYGATGTTNKTASMSISRETSDPVFRLVPLTMNFVALTSNTSVLTPTVTAVTLGSPGADPGKVIVGDPITSQSVTVNKTGTGTATLVLLNTGSATSSGAGDVAGTSTIITVGSAPTAFVPSNLPQTLGTVVVENSANPAPADPNDTITLSATVISRAGASVLAIDNGSLVLPFNGHFLLGGTGTGHVAVTNGTAYAGLVQGVAGAGLASVDTTAVVGVPAVGNTLIPFTISATTPGHTSSGITLKNAASDSAAAGKGNAQPNMVSSFFDIFVEATAQTPADGSFGPAYGSNVPPGGYAGLSSKSGSPKGTEAKLLSGTGAGPVTMAWRMASAPELAGDPAIFSTSLRSPHPKLISDVVEVNGVTGVYTLQMSYDDSGFVDELGSAQQGHIQIAWLNNGVWVPAQGNESSFTGIIGTVPTDFSTFAVGQWGVDTQSNIVWEVLNHNSQFAVVPEPATVGLLGLAALGLLVRRRHQAV